MEKENSSPTQKIRRDDPKGVVSPRLLRNIAFAIITFSLVVSTVLCILGIWQFTASDAIWRAIATFMVVSVATGILTFVNEKLG